MMEIIKNTLTGFGLLLISAQSMAALVQISGDTVDFIYDTDAIDPLFGTLYVSGDSIFATPTAFSASTSNGVDVASAIGTIQVVVKDGYQFTAMSVGESGIYNLSGTGTVDVDASLRLFDWDAAVPGFGTEETTNLTSATDFSLNDGVNHDWLATGGFDMTASLWSDVTHVGLRLTNILTATSGADGQAYIDKSAVGAVGFTVETTVIPVPAAVWLFASGLLGLVGVARKRA